MTEFCEKFDIPKYSCAHCQGIPEDPKEVFGNDDPIEFEILAVFSAKYPGTCTVDRRHQIKRGDRVARIQRADNPMLTVSGVACKVCIRDMRNADE